MAKRKSSGLTSLLLMSAALLFTPLSKASEIPKEENKTIRNIANEIVSRLDFYKEVNDEFGARIIYEKTLRLNEGTYNLIYVDMLNPEKEDVLYMNIRKNNGEGYNFNDRGLDGILEGSMIKSYDMNSMIGEERNKEIKKIYMGEIKIMSDYLK